MTRWTDDDLDELLNIVDELTASMWITRGGDYRLFAGRVHELRKRKQMERLDGKTYDHG